MGLINYYRRFAKRHAHKLANLTHLLKSASKWKWGSAENESFNEIKLLFTKDMFLNHPDMSQTFYLQTDSSGKALGANLYQVINGE
jgi:hypothetical protein